MNRMDEHVNRFENVIMELKAPLLDATDTPINSQTGGEPSKNTAQDIEQVFNEVGSRMDELYTSVKSIIDNHGVPAGAPLNTNTLNQVFLQNGVNLGELCKDREMKEKFLNSLNILLKEYPLTRSRKHIIELKVSHTEAPKIIIPNKE